MGGGGGFLKTALEIGTQNKVKLHLIMSLVGHNNVKYEI